MQDIRQRLEKLRTDAEECLLISRLATNRAKREAFEALAEKYNRMAEELEELLASGKVGGDLGI